MSRPDAADAQVAEGVPAPGATLPAPVAATEVVITPTQIAPEAAPPRASATPVEPGTAFGPRYEIVKLLGKGGMGAVYLAHDRELGRDVALKLIAPHLASDRAVLERFKREIQLSSIVTHPNVLRVYDLGESDGVKFLTMQYIDGESLADVLHRERPLPPDRALSLIRQIGEGLAAAHERGVLHRDLKPQNVMLDRGGHVFLTDFGLATSSDLSTMTQAGALMGTPQYMSPEQVKGVAADARSDLFSLGVMMYEMLGGALPYHGDTLFEVMITRTQAPPRPLREVKPELPRRVSDAVDRCLAVAPDERYASVAELLQDLDDGTAAPPRARRRRSRTAAGRSLLALVSVAALAGGAGAWRYWPRQRAPTARAAAAVTPRTVLVGDFRNYTGDAMFDGTLESALGLALENASFITSYNRDSARKVADQLGLEGRGLDPNRARLVGQREGVEVVTTGAITRSGSGYRVSLHAVDSFGGKDLLEHAVDVSTKDEVLTAASILAARLRANLGDATPQEVQLAQAEAFSAKSVEAAHAFSSAVDLTRQAKHEQARAQYFEALKLDPGLGRAYIGLAVMERNLGHHADAERYLKEAMARLDRMSEREKHRSRGYYYLFQRDFDRAIEAYEELVKQFPVDASGHGNLAVAYQMKRDFARALAGARRALQLNPRNHLAQHNVGLFQSLKGDFDGAIGDLEKAIEQSPRYANAYIALALAQEMSGKRDAAIATWEKLRAIGPAEASAAGEGLADLALAEGRLGDARKLVEAEIAADRASKNGEMLARKHVLLAELHLARGDSKRAAQAAERALSGKVPEYVTFAAARVLAEAGDENRANQLADELDRKFSPEPRMYADLVRGLVKLKQGGYPDAVARFKAAGQRVDSWLGHLLLARAYLAANAFTEAQDELERCMKRRGEATDVYLDDVPTYRVFPPVLYHLARAAEGVGSPAAPSYEAFLRIKRADDEPMVADARRRLH